MNVLSFDLSPFQLGFHSLAMEFSSIGLARDQSQRNWAQVGPIRKVPLSQDHSAIKAEDGCGFQNKAESWLLKLGQNHVVRGPGSEAQCQGLSMFPTQMKAEWVPWWGAQL